MDIYGKIAQKIAEIAKGGKLTPSIVFVAQVEKVSKTTCEVSLDGLILSDVRLCSVINNNAEKVLMKPKIGSNVLVLDLSNGQLRELAIICYSEIDAINILIGETKIDIDNNGVVFNNGSNGGMTITPELKAQLDTMSERIDQIITCLGTGAVSGMNVVFGRIAEVNAMPKESFNKIENKKIKQ